MDPLEISRFAKHLRESGDKVLNANFKLTLSGGLLRALNDSFSLIADENEMYAPQTFQVVKPNNSKSDAFRDLQFIHDFVQKTKILRLTNFQNDDFDGVVDVSKFRCLKTLETQRIAIHRIIGIQRMRPYLWEITCNRSIESVQDIISHCGGDNCTGFKWDNLNAADFSYNLLTTIDCSLEFAPSLQHLNLSHNQIVSVDAIKWLPNLKSVNLGFNRLKYIPRFHKEATRRLQTLILTSNFIEDISGISSLDALSELDVSGNCILDHASLLPLSSLINLSFLDLHGNPLSFHPNHRQITAKCLHKNTSSVKFVFDRQPLSKAEKALTGSKALSSKFLPGLLRSSGRSTPTISSRLTDQNTPSSSIGSNRSNRLHEAPEGNSTSDMNVSKTTSQKKIKKRPAEIADINDDPFQEKTAAKDVNFEGNKDHLETKKQIESLRKQYGDGWLHLQGATKVNEVLGNKSEIIKKSESTERMLDLVLEEAGAVPFKKSEYVSSSPIKLSQDTIVDVVNSSNEKPTEENDASANSGVEDQPNDYSVLTDIYGQANVSEVVVSDSEENEVHYIVCLEPTDIEGRHSRKNKDPMEPQDAGKLR